MIEVRDVDTARAMLRQTRVFAGMRQEDPERFQRLDTLCGRTYFDIRCVYFNAWSSCLATGNPVDEPDTQTLRFHLKRRQSSNSTNNAGLLFKIRLLCWYLLA